MSFLEYAKNCDILKNYIVGRIRNMGELVDKAFQKRLIELNNKINQAEFPFWVSVEPLISLKISWKILPNINN